MMTVICSPVLHLDHVPVICSPVLHLDHAPVICSPVLPLDHDPVICSPVLPLDHDPVICGPTPYPKAIAQITVVQRFSFGQRSTDLWFSTLSQDHYL